MSIFDDPKIVVEKISSSIPKIGEKYHFFDDGKIRESCHYIATVVNIITLEDTKNITITKECYNKNRTLYQIWEDETYQDLIYASQTDFLVVCFIPHYDDDLIYFTRTNYGGWFSLNVTIGWQSGELDLDGRLYNRMLGYYRDRDMDALDAEGEILELTRVAYK